MFLAHTFLAYFVGVSNLMQWMGRSPIEHPGPFLVMAFTTGAMMFDFCFFREQTCIVACPYGRFQSVMLDRDSLIVSYDTKRGEPRGKGRREKSDGTSLGTASIAATVSTPVRPGSIFATGCSWSVLPARSVLTRVMT